MREVYIHFYKRRLEFGVDGLAFYVLIYVYLGLMIFSVFCYI